MNTSEVLDKAADRIEREGWWGFGVIEAPNCAANAIFYECDNDARAASPAQAALLRHIDGVGLGDIFKWNDAPERTKAEVIETLRAAAVIEAAKETADERESVSA